MIFSTIALVIGAIALVTLIRKRLRPEKPSIVLGMLAGGWGMTTAAGGWLTEHITRLTTSAADAVGGATSQAVGVSVPALILAATATVIYIDLRDTSRIWRITPWLGLMTPTLAVVVASMYAGGSGLLGTVAGWLRWVLLDLPLMLG